MPRLTINGQTHNIDVDPIRPRCCGPSARMSALPAPNTAAASRNAAPAPFRSTAWPRAPALPVGDAERQAITTIEGLAQNGVLHKVQKAWIDHDVPQCGYCQSGQIMAAVELLKNKPKPTDADIDREMTNICRCGTFQQIRAAIHAAAKA